MQYIIHSQTHDILLALQDNVSIPSLGISAFVRQADLPPETPIDDLIYDADLDTVRLKTAEEKLADAKEAKLEELKAQVQSEFSNIPDALADAVKAIKLVMKFALLIADPNANQSDVERLRDHLTLILQKFEQIYPDDYAISCVASYGDAVVSGLARYYQAKMQVLAATSLEEVEAVTLE